MPGQDRGYPIPGQDGGAVPHLRSDQDGRVPLSWVKIGGMPIPGHDRGFPMPGQDGDTPLGRMGVPPVQVPRSGRGLGYPRSVILKQTKQIIQSNAFILSMLSIQEPKCDTELP